MTKRSRDHPLSERTAMIHSYRLKAEMQIMLRGRLKEGILKVASKQISEGCNESGSGRKIFSRIMKWVWQTVTFGRRIRVISVMGWDFTAGCAVEVAKAAYQSCKQRWYRVNDALC